MEVVEESKVAGLWHVDQPAGASGKGNVPRSGY